MLRRLFSVAYFLIVLVACVGVWMVSEPAMAAVDDYVVQFLKVDEPIALDLDKQGNTSQFSAEALSEGKQLFKQHCMSCHVGGTTLQDPTVSLSLEKLAGATPPRDTINGLVAFLRQPMSYDGSEESYWCRKVTERWMPQAKIEKLAAFVLRAAQKAPGWGVNTFEL